MRTAVLAIITGTGVNIALQDGTKFRLGTPYGPSTTITLGRINKKNVALLPRHGEKHEVPPHKINYRANIWALQMLNVERILATNAVGAINVNYTPRDIIIPYDFIDLTKQRSLTFYDNAPITHIDVTNLYCSELREQLFVSSKKRINRIWNDAIYLCTEGPRYESPAEIRMYRSFGCDVVGMTGFPEAILAHELNMCYATLCFVSNMAAGIQGQVSTKEVAEEGQNVELMIKEILVETVNTIPRKRTCMCSRVLEGARF
jgi:5'-methylthioadenosine phosphorylase